MATAGKHTDDGRLAARLRKNVKGDVLFDDFSRGRYSTDASIYQIVPRGVVVAKDLDDVRAVREICVEEGVPMLPRGGGTSQCGQTVGDAVVIDHSKHLNGVLDFDAEASRITVQPGIVLDVLNRRLQPHGLFFPVDVSTSSRATIGGMTGNNSCGARSLRYGNMVHNVLSIDAMLSNGEQMRFGSVPAELKTLTASPAYRDLISDMRSLHSRYADDIAARFPSVLRRVGGYNIDSISPQGHNMAHLLVGSEGTLSWFNSIELSLQPIPRHRVLGVCHFDRFYDAMAVTRHIVTLDPAAVELVDRIMIDLALDNPSYRSAVEMFLKGKPEALLLVEFAGDDLDTQTRRLDDLATLLADHGFPDAVVPLTDPARQRATWEVRKAGLNIMMSMKGDGKPVSFIEDCAVPLEHLADYTDRLTQVFAKHGTYATWYAHASVGCLHVRPVLNMKTDGAQKMRAIAEEAMAIVREYKGSHSGEHGDGLVRSEWHETMFGADLVRAFEAVKDRFDPIGLLNPGKIVRAPKMDDRTLFRYKPDYATEKLDTALDWSAWGGLPGAVEMCNNNGTCRKAAPGVMCPSFRATGDERHLTRGRANTLRLALSGQLGRDALTSDEMYDTMDLCVSCKGCRRECPTGVDMARMKVEFLNQYHRRRGLSLRERLIAYLPRYAPLASRLAPLLNLRDRLPGLARLSEKTLGFSARRSLPRWRTKPFRGSPKNTRSGTDTKEVVLLADTFNTYFEPENAHAARAVLEAAGYHVHAPETQGRPPCCGRTFLASGLVDQAREEAQRMLQSLSPFLARDIPVVGLEPSCLLTLRDEFQAMKLDGEVDKLAANSFLFEEFLQREHAAGRLNLALKPIAARKALLHGHCHQKAFGLMPAISEVLKLIPELEIEVIESSCCGMAGAFGYEAKHYEISMKMGELSLLPAVRAAAPDTVIVADGTSCRHQIRDGAEREAIHVARLLQSALA